MAVFLATSAGAAEISYRFKILNITVPGQAIPGAGVQDINDHNSILGSAHIDGKMQSILSTGNGHRRKTEVFTCPSVRDGIPLEEHEGISLSNHGQVVGVCSYHLGETFTVSGFFRNAKGQYTFLDVPGAQQTVAQGISPGGGYVTGWHWSSVNGLNCFLWNRKEFQTIQYPMTLPGTYTESLCYAVNRSGKVLGEYWVKDFGNVPLEHGFFVWDKETGQFSVDLPLSLDFQPGQFPYHIAYDINNDGAILGLASVEDIANDRITNQLFYWDDGQIYTITSPQDWLIYNLGGMNNSGDFVGRVSLRVGVDQECFDYYGDYYGCGYYEDHSFIASPRRGALARLP